MSPVESSPEDAVPETPSFPQHTRLHPHLETHQRFDSQGWYLIVAWSQASPRIQSLIDRAGSGAFENIPAEPWFRDIDAVHANNMCLVSVWG